MATLFSGDGCAAGVTRCSGFVPTVIAASAIAACRAESKCAGSNSAVPTAGDQQSPEGREDHRDRQGEYRRRRRIRARVTDQGSASITSPGRIPAWDARSALTATRVGKATGSVVQSPTLQSWRRAAAKLDPLFLCCAWSAHRNPATSVIPGHARYHPRRSVSWRD
jgi:hypothetical protein